MAAAPALALNSLAASLYPGQTPLLPGSLVVLRCWWPHTGTSLRRSSLLLPASGSPWTPVRARWIVELPVWGGSRPCCLPFLKFCRECGAGGQVSPSGRAQYPGQAEIWGRGLYSPCAALAEGPGVSHPSTMRPWALAGPWGARTSESPARPRWPLCPEAESGNPPKGLWGRCGGVSGEHTYPSSPGGPALASPSTPHSALPAFSLPLLTLQSRTSHPRPPSLTFPHASLTLAITPQVSPPPRPPLPGLTSHRQQSTSADCRAQPVAGLTRVDTQVCG